MELTLKKISHILKDIFDFVQRTEKYLEIGTVLRVSDFKSLWKNILHELRLKTLNYWIGKLEHKIEHLQRFTKISSSEGMSIILRYNYFYVSDSFINNM